jgi:hypothetical protein
MIALPLTQEARGERQEARGSAQPSAPPVALEEQRVPGHQPLSSSDHKPLAISHSLFEEWGYAERAWYLEGRTGISGIVRALFWPTEGVVEVGVHDRVWADRTPQPPAERFSFQLSDQGYARLHDYLQSTIAEPKLVLTVGSSRFYPATRSYHLFHHCHQYAALALREAGLPLSPGWALSRGLFAMQLRRAERLATEDVVPKAP